LSASAARAGGGTRRAARARSLALAPWWPLAALLVVAAALRVSTLSLQSFWYDEAYTPVHVLHSSLAATLHSWLHDEDTPPLWYLVAWLVSRVFGTGLLALRMPSALSGVGLVWIGWAIGAELGSRRTAITLAAIVAVNPMFVWYSQEARSYALYTLLAGASLLCFLRARRLRTSRSLAWWSLSSVLAMFTHLFAVFLVAPEALLLAHGVLARRSRGDARARTATIAALGTVAGSSRSRATTCSAPTALSSATACWRSARCPHSARSPCSARWSSHAASQASSATRSP
jgi:uncharacterized membrane protein